MSAQPMPFDVGTTPEELADRLPWIGNFVLLALESEDAQQNGLVWVRHLATICSRAEAHLIRWEQDRLRERQQAPSTA